MIEHAVLGRLLQPGGHLDPSELPSEAAARELLEETGLRGARIHFPGGAIDVDVHAIPANAAKCEPAHLHADFAYVFETLGGPLAGEAGAAASWRDLAEYAACDARSARIAKRLKWRSSPGGAAGGPRGARDPVDTAGDRRTLDGIP